MINIQENAKYKKWFWILNSVSTLIRLLIIGRIGLSGDESHYWAYSRNLDLSYFDHPPLIGYLIKIFTSLFGANEFALRLPTVLLFFFTTFLIYKLAEKLYNRRIAFWAAAVLNVMPVFSFLGSVLTVPDAPMAFFWMLFIWIFWKIMENDRANLWYVAGVVLGFGLLSKYNAILIVPSTFLFLVFSQKHRKWLTRKEPYIALLIAFIIFLPVVVWNLMNNFASFGFQLQHGFGKEAPSFSLTLLGRCLGAQAAYVSPLLFFVFWGSLFYTGYIALKEKNDKALLLFSFSFPTLFLFNFIASFNEILPHWPTMGYLILTISVSEITLRLWRRAGVRVFTYIAWGLGIFLTLLVPLQSMYKILPPEKFLPASEASRIEDGITRAEKIDITNELYGWDEVGREIADIIERSSEPKPFVFTHRHYIASQLNFYVPNLPRIYCLSDRIDAYDFWQRDLTALDGRDGIFIANDYFYTEPQKIFPFETWQETKPLEIYRSERKIRIFWITQGQKFNLKRLKSEYTSDAAGSPNTLLEGLRKYDYKVFWFVNKGMHFPVLDSFMMFITKVDVTLGVNTGLVFVAACVGVILWLKKRERFWPEFLLAIVIIMFGGILVALLKDFFGRARPLGVFGSAVNIFNELLYKGSFPSGHTQIAFSVATFLTSRFKKYWWLFFTFACMAGFFRVYIGVHFPLDVLAGAIVGTIATLILLKLSRYLKVFK